MHRRVLVLGLDGATFDLLLPWIEKGYLPNLSALMKEGVRGNLRSTIPPLTGPACSSFMTGKSPGKLGIFDFVVRKPGAYGVELVRRVPSDTIWDIFCRRNLPACVFNVPGTYPPYGISGCFVSGLLTPSRQAQFTWPASLKQDLDRLTGGYELLADAVERVRDSSVDTFLRNVVRVTEKQIKVITYLLDKEWQFFMAYLDGTDSVQHALWKYMDPTHPHHDPKEARKYGDAILRYWQRMDEVIGMLKARISEDTTLVLMSDHGFGKYDKVFYTNEWLKTLGYLRLRTGRKEEQLRDLLVGSWLARRLRAVLRKLRISSLLSQIVPKGARPLVTVALPFEDFKDRVDWLSTKAYSLPHSSNFGHIYINLEGRDPQGCVGQGKAYEETREEIIKALQQLRHPGSGHIVKVEAYKAEDIYAGPYVHQAPDLVFFIDDMRASFRSSLSGQVLAEETLGPFHNATHRMNGIFIAFGKDIRAGEVIRNAGIIDMAPTLLHILDLPIPRDMDGRVLKGIFREDSELARKEIEYLEPDERAALRERVRKLRGRLKEGGPLERGPMAME